MTQASSQVFNHVAMTVPSGLIDEAGTREILDFYREVFGWTEMPGMTKPGEVLVLRCHSNEQFLFIVAGDDQPMKCPEMDHFGVSVKTEAEFDGLLERAKKYQARDERVKITDKKSEKYPKILTLHNFYTHFKLPMSVEVQCYEWAEGLGPDSQPD
jgi:hypothetical protein